jgi:hypothetical protein
MYTGGVIMKLQELLTSNKGFQKLSAQQKTIFLEMATQFEQRKDNLYYNIEELAAFNQPFSRSQWSEFLDLEPTRQYIRSRMQKEADIMERKLFQTLEEQALSGNVQAARELKSFVQTGSKSDKTVVILHAVPRPQPRVEK